MKYIKLNYNPPTQSANLFIAFKGWPDAGESATNALDYLLKEKNGKLFASIDPEEFFDFIRMRPEVRNIKDNDREIIWPENEFFYFFDNKSTVDGNMIFLGIEPNLKWRTFSNLIIDLAISNGVKRIIFVGSLLDDVPHSRSPLLSGFSTNNSLDKLLHEKGIYPSNYQGPTGISSAIMEACVKNDLEYVSIWGHVPHYLKTSPNYRISFSILQILTSLFSFSLALNKMSQLAFDFDLQIREIIEDSNEIKDYVEKLEDEYDQKTIFDNIHSSSLDLVHDLEEFLRKRKN